MMHIRQERGYRGFWKLRGAKFENMRQERKEGTSRAVECLPKAGYPLWSGPLTPLLPFSLSPSHPFHASPVWALSQLPDEVLEF